MYPFCWVRVMRDEFPPFGACDLNEWFDIVEFQVQRLCCRDFLNVAHALVPESSA